VKVARGVEKLSDGVTHAPVFLIRSLLRELPAFYLDECAGRFGELMDAKRFYHTMAASYASRRDLRTTPTRIARAENFQKCYQRLIDRAEGSYEEVLTELRERAAVINYEHRITGNAVINAVEQLVALKDEARRCDVQAAIDRFIESQVLIPGRWRPIYGKLDEDSRLARLLRVMQAQLEECKETV
jgi:hypothetical protein